jgi:hypothetical protein
MMSRFDLSTSTSTSTHLDQSAKKMLPVADQQDATDELLHTNFFLANPEAVGGGGGSGLSSSNSNELGLMLIANESLKCKAELSRQSEQRAANEAAELAKRQHHIPTPPELQTSTHVPILSETTLADPRKRVAKRMLAGQSVTSTDYHRTIGYSEPPMSQCRQPRSAEDAVRTISQRERCRHQLEQQMHTELNELSRAAADFDWDVRESLADVAGTLRPKRRLIQRAKATHTFYSPLTGEQGSSTNRLFRLPRSEIDGAKSRVSSSERTCAIKEFLEHLDLSLIEMETLGFLERRVGDLVFLPNDTRKLAVNRDRERCAFRECISTACKRALCQKHYQQYRRLANKLMMTAEDE